MTPLMSDRIVAYCERGAWRVEIRKLWRERKINVIHFPYDDGDRRWHDNNSIPFATPSLVTMDTSELFMSDVFLISEMTESGKHLEIARILHQSSRAIDVRHFDSAHKSKARVFVSEDRNYSNHSSDLYGLTGIHVIDPSRRDDMTKLYQLIQENADRNSENI
jgi:hypothetical protein